MTALKNKDGRLWLKYRSTLAHHPDPTVCLRLLEFLFYRDYKPGPARDVKNFFFPTMSVMLVCTSSSQYRVRDTPVQAAEGKITVDTVSQRAL